jgi:hypothetical protein
MRLRPGVLSFQALLLIAAGCGGHSALSAAPPSTASPPEPTGGADGATTAPSASDDMVAPEAVACVRVVPVATQAALAAALAAARPGDCITLADGEYTFPRVTTQGTAAQPIVLQAAHVGGARVATGGLVLDGAAYTTVAGLDWTSSDNLTVVDGDHDRITRCRFHPAVEVANVDWVSLSGRTSDTRIDHNDFGPKNVISNMVMLSGAGAQVVQHTRIDHNYFHDIHRTTGNGWETIRAGLSGLALSSGYTVIESNLFVGCDGDPETISIKQSDAVVRYNTLRTTAGEITLRLGNRNQVYGNFILGGGVANTGGIRVCGSDHTIYDNYVQDIDGIGILLEGGESDGTDAGTAHYRVHHGTVVFNTIVGMRGIVNGSAGRAFEPIDCTIANNLVQGASGGLFTISGATNTTYAGNIAFRVGGGSFGMTVPPAQIRAVDPKLVAAGEIVRLGAGSPAVDAAVGSYPFVHDDVDGDARVAPFDVGADELSTAKPSRHPLTSADVGTNAP